MADRAVYAALLRGINVGGNVRILMADLRETVESLGHADVVTYIQSGNVVFRTDSKTAEAVLAGGIHDAIHERLGLDVDVMVRSRADLEEALAGVPFPVDDPKRLIVSFLAEPPRPEAVAALLAVDAGAEQIQVVGRVAYLDLPNGVGQSVLAPLLERRLRVRATARNLATVGKLLALMDVESPSA
jgi:uncharacterized protein (DUF1697 family)